MILSPKRLFPLISHDQVISGLSQRELENPEGAGYDLRVKSVNKIIGSGSLLIETRKTSEVYDLSREDDSSETILDLEPNGLYLVTTIESFTLSENMLAVFHPRSTLFRSGVIFQSGVAPYGYEGPMTFLLYIANPLGFRLQLGARFAHVNIMEVDGGSSAYRGQWQHGRVTTSDEERQK
jgi:deoxycytidine triphosphate deaminase